jgi:hypothetical protein
MRLCWFCMNATAAVHEGGQPAAARQHVVAGAQRDNVIRMAYTGRGGARPVVRRNGLRARQERSVALRDGVRHGWDSDAVSAALLGSAEPTLSGNQLGTR